MPVSSVEVLDLSAALQTALQAADIARQILLAECARPDGPRGEIGHCPADDEAEWAIRKHLLAAFPDWGYLGEETGASPRANGGDCVWIVDPNDGTRPMQRGYRGHAVSIGLVRLGAPVLGVVCAVDAPDDRGDLVAWAEGCGPIRRNGRVVEPVTWRHSLGRHDVVCLSLGANRNPIGNLAAVAPARFLGMPSIAYRLALVAVGDCVAAVSLQQLSAWDFAAGHALVCAAGGVVVDENGLDIVYAPDGQSSCARIFAGARKVVDRLLPRVWAGVSHSGFGEAAPAVDRAPVRAQPGKLIHDSDMLSRAQGCLLGQFAGDALGALVDSPRRLRSPDATALAGRTVWQMVDHTASWLASQQTTPSWQSYWRAVWWSVVDSTRKLSRRRTPAGFMAGPTPQNRRRAVIAGVGRSTWGPPRLERWATSPPTTCAPGGRPIGLEHQPIRTARLTAA